MSTFPTDFAVQLPLAQHYFVVLTEATGLPDGQAAVQKPCYCCGALVCL